MNLQGGTGLRRQGGISRQGTVAAPAPEKADHTRYPQRGKAFVGGSLVAGRTVVRLSASRCLDRVPMADPVTCHRAGICDHYSG